MRGVHTPLPYLVVARDEAGKPWRIESRWERPDKAELRAACNRVESRVIHEWAWAKEQDRTERGEHVPKTNQNR